MFPDDAEDPDPAPDAAKPAIKHWSEGKAGDGIVCLNNDMEHCKIDKRGAAYKVGKMDESSCLLGGRCWSTRPKNGVRWEGQVDPKS